jgi:hypothetical protein
MGAVFAFAGALPANAATKTGSYAEGQFLSGTIAGLNLDQIVALESAEARNDGSSAVDEVRDPLSAAVLQAIKLNVPGGVQLDLGDVIDAGALSQYAQAKSNGTAVGASGAVSGDGSVGVGAQGAGGGSLSVDLDSLLSSGLDDVIADLRLDVEAVAAQANVTPDDVSGKYSLAGLKLKFTSPALASVGSSVNAAVDDVTTDLNGLTGTNGTLTQTVNGLLTSLSPVLGILGTSASANAAITTDLKAPLVPLLTGTYSTDGITLDLATGAVVVDLEKLLGGTLNSKAPGTEVLSDSVVNEILNALTDQIASIADQVKNQVALTLKGAKVDVDVSVNALSSTPGTPGQPAIPSVPGIVCGVLDLLGLCTPTAGTPGQPAVPAVPGISLASTAEVHVDATVDQLLNGTAAQAVADVKLLGGTVNAKLDVNALLGGLGGALNNALFDNDSAITDLVNDLQTGLLNPTVTALIGPADNTLSEVLKGLVSVKLNIKETTVAGSRGMALADGSLFTQTALRVSVLPDTGATGLATLNLAQATVGSAVPVVVDPGDPGDPGGPGDPDDPTTGQPGGPGDGGNGSFPAAFGGSLAFTGVGIASLVAILLALLAAGAYLAREGYRRRQVSE